MKAPKDKKGSAKTAERRQMTPRTDDLQGIQSVETGLSVLDVLADGVGPMTLGEVARGSGLSLSQARRYLVSLVRHGVATQDPSTGLYDLGPGALRIGLSALGRIDAIELATVALKELAGKIHEVGTLAVWGDQGATIIRWFRGPGIGVTTLGLGTVFPIFNSATGRVFLTYLPPDITDPRLERELGAKAISAPLMKKEIARIKKSVIESGAAVLEGHFLPNIRGAAAPVFDSQGDLVAVLAIAGSDKTDRSGTDPAVAALISAAARVSAELGYKRL